MAEASDTRGIFHQNLIDAGCNDELIRRCVVLDREKKIEKLLEILSNHRQNLLDIIHQQEKQIDCLNYLVYQIKREQKGGIIIWKKD